MAQPRRRLENERWRAGGAFGVASGAGVAVEVDHPGVGCVAANLAGERDDVLPEDSVLEDCGGLLAYEELAALLSVSSRLLLSPPRSSTMSSGASA